MTTQPEPLARSTAIVIVHGVQPHPRYEIQDECATNLAAALNTDDYWGSLGMWVCDVVNPPNRSAGKNVKPVPTTTRVHLVSETASSPETYFFDVIEGYWSPLDKGKTNAPSIGAWLLRTLFVPLNTSARYEASRKKVACEFALLALGFCAIAFFLAALAYATLATLARIVWLRTPGANFDWFTIVRDPSSILHVLDPWTIGVLAAGSSGAFLLAQVIKSIFGMIVQREGVTAKPAQLTTRLILDSAIFVLGSGALCFSCIARLGSSGPLGWFAIGFISAAFAFEGLRAVAKSFFVNFFQDIQIYTNRDENNDFFAIREEILETVTTTIYDTCGSQANGGEGYDRVFTLGHSLGSTIALDAILRIYNISLQDTESETRFKKLRGFVTFGTALEKTKYFFDAVNPGMSESMEQWENDAYGPLFVDDVDKLDAASGPIVWVNYWYFADAVSNEIESYRSFLPPGSDVSQSSLVRMKIAKSPAGTGSVGRLVCRNEQGSQGLCFPEIIPHGKYLLDPWFWHSAPPVAASSQPHVGVLDLVARLSKLPFVYRKTGVIHAKSYGVAPTAPEPTVERMPLRSAQRFRDRY